VYEAREEHFLRKFLKQGIKERLFVNTSEEEEAEAEGCCLAIEKPEPGQEQEQDEEPSTAAGLLAACEELAARGVVHEAPPREEEGGRWRVFTLDLADVRASVCVCRR
jgi:hypothetical protein